MFQVGDSAIVSAEGEKVLCKVIEVEVDPQITVVILESKTGRIYMRPVELLTKVT